MKKILLITLCLCIFPVLCFADFTDNGDGTITDNDTGLMWKQATVDTDGDLDIDIDDTVTWENALSSCANLDFAGQTDWRLPTNKELQSIVDYTAYTPTINAVFTDTISTWYWSSTTYVDNTDSAWAVYFYYGYVEGKPKINEYYVRAVRGSL